jgi:hypothetical protein
MIAAALVLQPDESAALAPKEQAAGELDDDSQRGLVTHRTTCDCQVVGGLVIRNAAEGHRRSALPLPGVLTVTAAILEDPVRHAEAF